MFYKKGDFQFWPGNVFDVWQHVVEPVTGPEDH
jgi:hypothetical protein